MFEKTVGRPIRDREKIVADRFEFNRECAGTAPRRLEESYAVAKNEKIKVAMDGVCRSTDCAACGMGRGGAD